MPEGYEIAQRGGFRGGGFRGGFPRGGFRGGFPGRFPGRFPMRFPMRFPGRFPMRFRRFPRFFFFPTFFPGYFPGYYPQGGCAFIDQFGRCCDIYGNCYYDYYGGASPQSDGSDDSVAVWSPAETWERFEEADEDYYDQY